MVKKYLPLILLATAFVILLVFLSRQYLTTTQQPWENYQDKQLGLEFSYPKDEPLIKHRNFNESNSSFEFRNLETINPNVNSEQFSIYGQVVSQITTPPELLQSSTDPNSAKLLDNANLVYGFLGDPPYSAYITYFPLSDNKYYEVTVRFSYIEQEKVMPFAKKILSTFKINPVSSTWKTYRNEKYGFEFQYPSSWEQVTDNFTTASIFYNLKETQSILVTIADKSKESTCGPYLCYSSVSVYPPFKNLSYLAPKKWIEDFYIKNKITDKSNFEKFNFEQSVANGASFLRDENSVFVFVDNRVFLMELQIQNGANEANLTDIYNQILHTVKFLPDTSTWKTQKINSYGFNFEFKYPKDWQKKTTDMGSFLISNNKNYELSIDFMNSFDATIPLNLWADNKLNEIKNDSTGPGIFFDVIKNNKIILFNQNPIIISSGNEGNGTTSYFVESSGEVLTINATENYLDDNLEPITSFDNTSEEIDQILSTFKFTQK